MAHCWSGGPAQEALPSAATTQPVVQTSVSPAGVEMKVAAPMTIGPAKRPALMAM